MSEVEDKLRQYLNGGDRDGFGGRDPWRSFSGGGGLDHVINVLAASVEHA